EGRQMLIIGLRQHTGRGQVTPLSSTSQPATCYDSACMPEQVRRQAAALRFPFEPIDSPADDPELWAEAPLELLVRFGCIHVGRKGRRLVLAFGDLDDPLKVDEIEFLLGRPVEVVVAPRERVEQALKR